MEPKQNRKSERQKNEFDEIPPNVKKQIIEKGDGKLINEWGEKLGKQYAEKKLSTSKIRKFFGGIERIKDFDENELQLLRPQLAYVVGKEKDNKAVKHFRDEIDALICLVTKREEFNNLKRFLESLVAYHRFHGGKVS